MKALRRSPHDRSILDLALPALGALAADPLVSLVDTAFVGRLGAEPLASLGVAVAIFGIAFALANFLPYGATPLIATATGSGDAASAGRIGRSTLALAVIVGGVGLLALEVLAAPVAEVMGATGVLREGTVGYLRVRALSLPAVLLVLAAHGIFRGHHDTRTPLVVSLGIAAVNLVLDPILIFALDLGLVGAAWATAAAQWLGALVFVWLLVGPRRQRLALDAGRGLDLRSLAAAGGALVVRTASLIGTFAVATAIAARVGTVAVAAHQVAFQIWVFLALVVDALAIAGQAAVAGHAGAGRPQEAREVADRLLGMGFVVGVVLALGLGLGAPFIPGWFSVDDAVVAAVGSVWPFVVLGQPLNALVFVWDGIAMGAGAFRFLAVWMVVAGVVSVGLLALVLPFDLGLTGVWWALLALMFVRGGSLAWWHGRGPLGRRRAPVSPAA